MPCYHPISGWTSKKVGESGKRPVVFDMASGFVDKPVSIPCGRCIGCRLERCRQWAVRCLHEARLHDSSLFVTLTYEEVPEGGSLRPRDFVLFMKRLRKACGPVRFFQCGEYGDQLGRPHHHALLFGIDFPDKKLISKEDGYNLYTSAKLEQLWGHGMVWIGSVSFESAGYVARYALKKITGPPAAEHYQGRVPEYGTMSRRPGIGAGWYERYRSDAYPEGSLTLRGGVKCRTPRFYDERFEKEFPEEFFALKAKRKFEAANDVDSTGQRLIVREVVTEAAIQTKLSRRYENADSEVRTGHCSRDDQDQAGSDCEAAGRDQAVGADGRARWRSSPGGASHV